MEKQYKEEDDAAKKAHGAKYKCKRCNVNLPLSRRYTCAKCADKIEEMGEFTPIRHHAHHPEYKPELAPAGEKQCTDCLQTKNFSEFYKQSTTKDKLMYRCKSCQKYRVNHAQLDTEARRQHLEAV